MRKPSICTYLNVTTLCGVATALFALLMAIFKYKEIYFFIGCVLNKFSRCLNFVEQISHIIYIPSVITYSKAINLLATSYLDVNLTM